MKKLAFIRIIILIFTCFFVFSTAKIQITYADDSGYTEEEKAAIKAWLSAHGYPPTRAGAAQAYQDFLDGKLDDDPDVRAYKGLDDDKDEKDSSSHSSDEGSGESSSNSQNDTSSPTDATLTDASDDGPSEDTLDLDINKHIIFWGKLSEAGNQLEIKNNNKYFLSYEVEKEKPKLGKTDVVLFIALVLVIISLIFAVKKPFKPVE